jgi:hypothetical protein
VDADTLPTSRAGRLNKAACSLGVLLQNLSSLDRTPADALANLRVVGVGVAPQELG